MQINQQNLNELFKAYRALYMEAFQGAPPVSDPFFQRVPSGSNEEVYAWLGSIPGMRKLVGEIVIQNLSAHRFSIVNEEFESTLAVKQKDVENDSYGVYNPLFAALGVAARQHQDEIAASLLVRGFTDLCYTGKAFFAANHEPQKGKAKFTNFTTKKLSQDNYRAARANLKGRVNADGRSMALGRNLQLIVSAKNESLGRQILEADTSLQAVASGAAAVTNVDKGTAKLEVFPQLSALNEDAWFVLEVGLPIKPLIWQENKAPIITALNKPDDDHVFKKHEFLYQVYGRYNGGYALPELAYGSTGADAA